jgi:hypothetical protein
LAITENWPSGSDEVAKLWPLTLMKVDEAVGAIELPGEAFTPMTKEEPRVATPATAVRLLFFT